jgi:hypothetical protein
VWRRRISDLPIIRIEFLKSQMFEVLAWMIDNQEYGF